MNRIILALIIFLGIILRYINILPYKFYPDAYQSLITAQNLLNYKSVVHPLGLGGYVFPPFFMWSRPIYPLLINIFNSAQLTSILLGVVAIPISYLFVSKFLKSPTAGIFAALSIAVSFNHTVWSGLIMTETTGVLFMLIFLLFLLKENYFASGIFLALAVFARYEYALLFIPTFFYIAASYEKPFLKILQVFASFATVSAIIVSSFFPIEGTIKSFLNQTSVIVDGQIKPVVYLGLWNFIKHDFLISIAGVAGLILMFKDPKYKKVAFFLLTSMILLIGIYFKINPLMERYITHLIPFLLIPVGFFWSRLPKKPVLLIFILILAVGQIYLSANGIKKWNYGDWTRASYEEISANKLKEYLNKDDIIIASLPEPYYFFTGHTTESINFDSLPPKSNIVIVADMPMKDIFPDFYEVSKNHLSTYKIGQYRTGTNYRYKNYFLPENQDVEVYRIKLWVLKDLISVKTTP